MLPSLRNPRTPGAETMMRLRRFCASLITSFLLIGAVSAQDQFLCLGDKGSGFKFDTSAKQWKEATFAVGDARYVVRKTKEGDAFKWPWIVTAFGEEFPHAWCEEERTEIRVECR
jgi:hypothetical protein